LKRWKTIRWHYPQVYESKRAATSWAAVVLAVLAAKQHNGATAAIPVLGTATPPGPTKRKTGVVERRAAKRRSYEGQNVGRAEHKLKGMALEVKYLETELDYLSDVLFSGDVLHTLTPAGHEEEEEEMEEEEEEMLPPSPPSPPQQSGEEAREDEAQKAWRREVARKISLQPPRTAPEPPETSSPLSAAGGQTTMLRGAQQSAVSADAETIMIEETAEEEAVRGDLLAGLCVAQLLTASRPVVCLCVRRTSRVYLHMYGTNTRLFTGAGRLRSGTASFSG